MRSERIKQGLGCMGIFMVLFVAVLQFNWVFIQFGFNKDGAFLQVGSAVIIGSLWFPMYQWYHRKFIKGNEHKQAFNANRDEINDDGKS